MQTSSEYLLAAAVALLLASSWGAGGAGGVEGAELLVFPDKPLDPGLLAYKQLTDRLHQSALRSRKPLAETALRAKVPSRLLALEKKYLKIKDGATAARALSELALLHAELAWAEKIRPITEAVEKLDPSVARRLGHFEESEHFFARVVGADAKWAAASLRLAEAAHAGYRELFGLDSISKVPGQKVRILIHVDPSHKRPRLYFHPSPPYYSELRYEIPDAKYLTLEGRNRIVYGFCHEMGHMLAMWGVYGGVEDDKHAWAHYTGCLVVEEVYDRLGNEPWPTWTAFQRRASGRARLDNDTQGKSPKLDSYEGILKLFTAVGDEFGTETYGRAWTWLESKKRFRRISNVRYLWLKDLREALLHVVPREKAPRVAEIFAE